MFHIIKMSRPAPYYNALVQVTMKALKCKPSAYIFLHVHLSLFPLNMLWYIQVTITKKDQTQVHLIATVAACVLHLSVILLYLLTNSYMNFNILTV